MNIWLGPLIKLRDKPFDKSEYLNFLQDLFARVNQIMRVLMEEKQQFENRAGQQLKQIRQQYEKQLEEKESMIEHLRINLQMAQEQNKRLEVRLNKELSEKEQSVQVLKGILKKRILNQVVRERENKTPTIRKIEMASLIERRRTHSKVQSLLTEGGSPSRRSHLSPIRKQLAIEINKRKSEGTTTASSRISSIYGSALKASQPSTLDGFKEDFI